MYKVPPEIAKRIISAYGNRPTTNSSVPTNNAVQTTGLSGGINENNPFLNDTMGQLTDQNYKWENGRWTTADEPISPENLQQHYNEYKGSPQERDEIQGAKDYVSILTNLASIAVPEVGLAKTAYGFGKDTYDVFAGNKNVSDYSKGLVGNLIGAGIGQATKGLAGQGVYDATKNPMLATLAEKLSGVVKGKASQYMTDKLFGFMSGDMMSQYGPSEVPGGYEYGGNPELDSGYDQSEGWDTGSLYGFGNEVVGGYEYGGLSDLGTTDFGYGADLGGSLNEVMGGYEYGGDLGYGDGGSGSGDDSGTVICTELHRQGLIDTDFYHAEAKYGYSLPIEIIEGYRAWATQIVRLMRKSDILTRIVHFFAQPVLNEMAHRADGKFTSSLIGRGALFMALPICSVIGRLRSVRNVKYAY
jgi:hypothetical protein